MTLYTNAFAKFNENYLGAATLSILGQSCLGGAAAMTILSNGTSFVQMIQLTIIVFLAMIANTAILAQLKHKIIFNSVLISVLASIFFIALNTL